MHMQIHVDTPITCMKSIVTLEIYSFRVIFADGVCLERTERRTTALVETQIRSFGRLRLRGPKLMSRTIDERLRNFEYTREHNVNLLKAFGVSDKQQRIPKDIVTTWLKSLRALRPKLLAQGKIEASPRSENAIEMKKEEN